MPWRLAAESDAAKTFTVDDSVLNDDALSTKIEAVKVPTHKPTHGNKNLSDLLMQKVTKQPSSRQSSFETDSQLLEQPDRQDELFFMTVTRSPTKRPSVCCVNKFLLVALQSKYRPN